MVGSGALIAPGDVLLNKYRVERLLGRGGMGLVVAARHIELDELFAIKLMLPEIAASAEAVERFLREARAAAKLKGDHVVGVQDVGRMPDGTPYMVMEHLNGSDLKELLKNRGPLPIEEAAAYILQACETLGDAHALGIVHRDIKPANMFLTRKRNGAPCIKVLDFGISKYTRGDAVGLTVTAAVGGSPLYMSPEQMRSAKHVDGRSDIWSLGIVFYELLTGTTPFAAETITAVAGRVLTEEPVPPSAIRRSLPPAIDAIVLQCLARRAEERFSTTEALAAALRSALSGHGQAVELGMDAPTLPIMRGSFSSVPDLGQAPPPRPSQPRSEERTSGPDLRARALRQIVPPPSSSPGPASHELRHLVPPPSSSPDRYSAADMLSAMPAAFTAAPSTTTSAPSTTTAGFGQTSGAPTLKVRHHQSNGVLVGLVAVTLLAGGLAVAAFFWLRPRHEATPQPASESTPSVTPAVAASPALAEEPPLAFTVEPVTTAAAEPPVMKGKAAAGPAATTTTAAATTTASPTKLTPLDDEARRALGVPDPSSAKPVSSAPKTPALPKPSATPAASASTPPKRHLD